MERMTASSSTDSATCGNMLLTGVPLCPYRLNLNGEAITFPLLLNWVRRIFTGIGLPCSSRNFGFGSNESTCDTPPDM